MKNNSTKITLEITLISILLVTLLSGFLFFNRNSKKNIFPNAKITASKSIYKATETPKFTLKLGINVKANFSYIPNVYADTNPTIDIAIFDSNKKEASIKTHVTKGPNDAYEIEAKSPESFRPGKYTIAANIKTPDGFRNVTQDFTWGVLAINTNKSIYQPGETAIISMGVLNDGGFNVCDASVDLSIQNPTGKTEIISTDNNKIKRSEECSGANVTYKPDYFSTYQTSTSGIYKIKLTAITKNGKYEINDFFEAKEHSPFDIERISATRINPVSAYKMTLKIHANENYDGEIVENLPFIMGVKKIENGGKLNFSRENGTNKIVWNKSLKKGDSISLSYEFKAPEVSPEFYLIGPFSIGKFSEVRLWQIAADPTKLILLWDPANGATPSGWTCVSCSTGDTFFQKFIRGNSTYGGTGGASTETPTVATLTVSAESAADTTAAAGTNAGSGTAHTHTASNPTIGSGSIVPAFKSLMVISNDSGIPTGASAIPANAIAIFDTEVPSGWTRYTATDGRYLRGDWTGPTGGSNTHTHTITWQSLAAASTAQDVLVGNGGTTAISAHTHTAPAGTSTASINSEPPYIEMVLGKANSTTSIPIGMIGMFDGAPGAGWTLKSNTGGDPFYQVFPKGAGSYGTTGGASTHNHSSEISGNSGNPSATTTNGNGALSVAGPTHTHTETVSFNTGGSNIPPYTDVIIAKKTLVVSGTVRQSDESTAIGNPPCDGSTNVIDIRVNGGTATQIPCLAADSTFSANVTATPSGQVITMLLNASSTPKANTIIVAGTSDITSADLYQNVVVARDELGSGITNANICTFTTSMLFSCSSNNITVNSNVEFHVWTTDTYTAGATLTTQGTGNLHIATSATATLDAATNTIGNNITVDTSGTLNINASTIVAGGSITATGTIATSGTPTLTMRGTGSISGAGTKTFYNLTIGDGTTATTTLSGAATVNNDTSVGTGSTFNINSNLAAAGNITTTTTGIINTTSGTPTVTMSGASKNIGAGAGGSISVYNLSVGGSATLTSDITANNTVAVTTGGSLALGSKNLTISGGGLTTAGTGTVTCTACSAGTVTIAGTGNIGGGGSVTAYNLQVNGTQTLASALNINNTGNVGTGATLNLGGQDVSSAGNFTTTTTGIISCTGTSGTFTMTAGGNLGGGSGAITFCNLATTTAGTTAFTGSGTNTVNNNITVGTGTTLNLNSSITVAGNLTNTTTGIVGTSAGTPTVTMSGSGKSIGGGSGTITFYNLNESGTGTLTSDITVNNDITAATGGSLDLGSKNITLAGNLSTAGTGTIACSGCSAGTITMSGSGKSIGGGGTVTVYNLTVNGTETLTSATTTNNNVSITNGASLALGSQNLTVSGGNITTSGTGAVTCTSCSAGTVTISGTGNIGGGGTVTAYNLTVNGSQTATSAINVNNALAVGGSSSLDMSTKDLTIGSSGVSNSGGIANSGTITQSSSGTTTILSSSGGTASIGGSGSTTFYNLTIAPAVAAAPTITLGTAASQTITVSHTLTIGNATNSVTATANSNSPTIDVNGDFLINSNGAFTAPPSSNFTIAGNMTNNGTFTHNSGTLTIDGAGTSVLSGSGNPAITFNNLAAVTGSKTLNFTAGETFRVNGLLTLTNQTINSTTASQWFINHQGTESVTGTTITNSGCNGASTLITVDITDTNGGNNGSCWDFASVIYPDPVKFVGTARIKGPTRIKN